MTHRDPSTLRTLGQAAAELGISGAWLRQLTYRIPGLTPVRIAGKRHFWPEHIAAIRTWIAAHPPDSKKEQKE
jgi:hypothetical protein